MVIKPQLVKFFHKEDSKRKPGYVGLEYAWRQKKDGVYGYYSITNGYIRGPFTRTGNLIFTLRSQTERMREELEFAIARSMIKNGRLIYEIRDLNDKADFHTVNGMVKKQKIQQEMKLFVHDMIDWDMPLEKGWERENSLFMISEHLPEGIEVLPILYQGTDIEKAKELYKIAVDKGWEGIVGKCMSTEYRPGARDYSLMKMKAETKVPGCKFIRHIPGDGNGAMLMTTKEGVGFTVAGIDEELYKKLITGAGPKHFDVLCMQVLKSGKPREPRLCK